MPANIFDARIEFLNLTNGRHRPHGTSLIGVLLNLGLPAMDAVEKEEMRQLILTGGPFTTDEAHAILDYCASDVDATVQVFLALIPHISNIDHSLLRGQFMATAARIENAGIPIDVGRFTKLQEHWDAVRGRAIERVDANYGVFKEGSFNARLWAQYLRDHRIHWPHLASGNLALDQDTFRERARAYPEIAPIHELRQMLGKLRVSKLAVGADGCNRTNIWAFTARTGRNQPRASEFIFGPAVWLRGLIRADPGACIAYADWAQQEFGIAAALSGDSAMIRAYESADPYLTFAKQAGAAPAHATKQSHADVREQFKTCALGTLYSMGPASLAERTGLTIPHAVELLRLHRVTYPQFWAWSDRVLDYALLHNHLYTTFGWNLFVEGERPACATFRCRQMGPKCYGLRAASRSNVG
jgi:DNA polymerase I-like protein with 3'-5' exonuclease and polymerase domains